ncbi:VOC family protein [Nocardia nova]|uniref:VOC family protein n=1 Tax=Nocardia nova TaxID=37330 RepID=UPI001C45BAFE|nr:VOC family protein [Nocardia nova]MBV7707023.1 VOC family protein [Nocardia nova]
MNPPPEHAHAVMHCNLNTVDQARAEAYYTTLFEIAPRMRSTGKGVDATCMGMPSRTDSETVFLYDRRGPRAAPALELVEWQTPATVAPTPPPGAPGLTAIGYRVPSLSRIRGHLAESGHDPVEVAGGSMVRGAHRPAVRLRDPDGVVVELVEIEHAPSDPQSALISHERLSCADLSASLRWYSRIGFAARARGEGWISLVLPPDPTFSLELDQAPTGGATPQRTANTQGLYRIALAVDDVRAAYAALAASGHPGLQQPSFIPMPDVPTGGFTVLFLADPDGVVVELVERPRTEVRRPAEPR